MPRRHPRPAVAPRRRARPRTAAGAPRPLRRRTALPLGGPRLGYWRRRGAHSPRFADMLHQCSVLALCWRCGVASIRSAPVYRISW
ncbi:polymerase delta 4 [Zea mays]|uniref:Polymerase delta 4 n=2 Tax=Zea mays TaxID=4577 RepID=A0A1D6IZN5_MAIZE|nr:polymerase delta 4 [Zea mays]